MLFFSGGLPGSELGRLLTRWLNLLLNLTITNEDTRANKNVKVILKPVSWLKLETFDSVTCYCKINNKNVHKLA